MVNVKTKTIKMPTFNDVKSIIDTSVRRMNIFSASNEIFKVSRNPKTYEVTIKCEVKLEDYRRTTTGPDWLLLEKFAKPMVGKSVVFINPTMEGGGVAMLRPPLVHLLKLLGVDAHWYVMASGEYSDDTSPFVFTKKMHNILQRRLDPNNRIDETGISIHQKWNAENAKILTAQPTIRRADVIVIDDPQPAPLKKLIDKVNPNVKWVWRSHIDTSNQLMSDKTTPQGEVAEYILDECGIRDVDAVIAHPVEEFIYPGMHDKTFFAPATIELRDDLNCPLTSSEKIAGIKFINTEIYKKNEELISLGRLDDVQSKIDMHRRQIVLIARFDESKGMDKAMALGVRTRQIMRDAEITESDLPQIIMVGNGSVDDPSGVSMYEKMLQIRRDEYPKDKKDIIIMRLKHNYKAMNALMSPAPGNEERHFSQVVALQTSEAEGCETRVSDWIFHGVPVVISNRGGISLQIVEEKSGLVMDFDKPDYDLERAAKFIFELMTSNEKYTAIAKTTKELASSYNGREFVTTANAIRLLRVFCSVMSGKKADKIWKLSQIVEKE